MKYAKLIKDELDNFSGYASLYELSEPLGGHSLVVVSAASGWAYETYIFGSDANGEVVDWCELDGSMRGTNDHAEALLNAGYTILE